MLVLGISGSPRQGGNSENLLEASLQPFLSAGWDAERFFLSNHIILPCQGCDTCREQPGRCPQEDAMAKVIEIFRSCDALIVATPVYYRAPTAQLMSLLQRHYCVREEKPLAGKPGGAIAVGRGTGGGQAIVLNVIYTWMLSCGMLCVPGELNGVSAVADGPGEIVKQEIRLRQAAILGENVMKMALRLQNSYDKDPI